MLMCWWRCRRCWTVFQYNIFLMFVLCSWTLHTRRRFRCLMPSTSVKGSRRLCLCSWDRSRSGLMMILTVLLSQQMLPAIKRVAERCLFTKQYVAYGEIGHFLSSVISQGKIVALYRWGGKWNHLSMTHRLTNNYAKNYCNRTLIVKVIAENIVTCFLWDTV